MSELCPPANIASNGAGPAPGLYNSCSTWNHLFDVKEASSLHMQLFLPPWSPSIGFPGWGTVPEESLPHKGEPIASREGDVLKYSRGRCEHSCTPLQTPRAPTTVGVEGLRSIRHSCPQEVKLKPTPFAQARALLPSLFLSHTHAHGYLPLQEQTCVARSQLTHVKSTHLESLRGNGHCPRSEWPRTGQRSKTNGTSGS